MAECEQSTSVDVNEGFRKAKKRSNRNDEIEDALTKKLFGVSSDAHNDDETSSDESCSNEPHIEEQMPSDTTKKQVWCDDDDQLAVNLPQHRRDVHLLRSTDVGHTTVNAEEYEKRLREAFIRTHGTGQSAPKWAVSDKKGVRKVESRNKVESEDESEADEVDEALQQMTASTGAYIRKSELLPRGLLSVSKTIDITRGHRSPRIPMRVVQFHPLQHVLMTGSEYGTVSLFEIGLPESEEHFLQDVRFEGFPLSCAAFSHDGMSIIAAMATVNCGSFALSADGRYMAVMNRNEIHVLSLQVGYMLSELYQQWYNSSLESMFHISFHHLTHSSHLQSMEYIHNLTTPTFVTSAQFSPNSSNFLYAMTGTLFFVELQLLVLLMICLFILEGGQVFIWDLRKSEQQKMFIDEGTVRGTVVRVNQNEQFIACGSNTGIVNLYEMSDVVKNSNPKPIKCFDQLTTSANSVCFSKDSQILAMSSSVKSNALRVAHLRSTSVFSNFPPRNVRLGQPTTCDFSPNNGYFAIGDMNGYLSLFRLNHFEKY
ncbi:unnamed protein product [Anisakis simplex]|uniref:WD_REPEATS_REGION domain-containing protein n=1 Tax=Anisakis simplex TaxID=6269 RepID=A0A158PPN5_ANISI|nr:unnamed protein product [Anisakis simplex]